MTVGFLHVGDAEHGVTRYGRVLAEALRTHTEATVVEADAGRLHGNLSSAMRRLRAATTSLAPAEIVHVQYNARVWGGPLRAPLSVRTFADACAAPFVVTVHDVRDGYGPLATLHRLLNRARQPSSTPEAAPVPSSSTHAEGRVRLLHRWGDMVRRLPKALRYLLREGANAWATRRMTCHAAQALVCTHEEARRLGAWTRPTPITVIPHFVESRPPLPATADAKRHLGLDQRRVVSILGFIHRRKGHDRLVEALPFLSDDVTAVFIGRAGRNDSGFTDSLRHRADVLGVADRLRITGFVPEDTLNDYLAATDLAACPFRNASASGSLSTWIATDGPIVTSALPLFKEYTAAVPHALTIAPSMEPRSLAATIEERLARPENQTPSARHALRNALSLSAIAGQHQALYRTLRPNKSTGHRVKSC